MNNLSSATAQDVIVAPAIPHEMNYELPSSLPNCKNFEIRVQPVNSQSFLSGNVIQIDIPCGRRGQYLDPNTVYIRYKGTYTHAGVNFTNYSRLLGSAYSPFIKQEVYGNNSVVLESINEVGVLASMLFNCQLNDGDKRGLSPAMGFAFGDGSAYGSSSTAGHRINYNLTTENIIFEYCMPLIGILGSGTDKMIPIGGLYGLRFELTVDNFANFTVAQTGSGITNFIISEFEFVGNVIELAPEAQALIEAANPSKIHIRSQSYRQASNILAAGTGVGTNDLLVGVRVSSLKSVYLACSPSDANERKYAGVNPNLDQGTCLIVAGQSVPQRTINPSGHPSDAFMELQKSFGALNLATFNGCISKMAYNTASTNYLQCFAYNNAIAGITSNPNQFYLGFDTEVVARKTNLLSGINVASSPMFFRAQVGSALAAVSHVFNFWGYYDLVLELDCATKNIVAKF